MSKDRGEFAIKPPRPNGHEAFHQWLEPEAVGFLRGTIINCPPIEIALKNASEEAVIRFNRAESFPMLRESLTELLEENGLNKFADQVKNHYDVAFPANGRGLNETVSDNPDLGAMLINIKTSTIAFLESLDSKKERELVESPS